MDGLSVENFYTITEDSFNINWQPHSLQNVSFPCNLNIDYLKANLIDNIIK